MLRHVFLAAIAGAALAAAPALAAPAGPEGPSSCSFSNGTTTCAHVGAPVVTTSTTSPDQNGCTTTSETTTTTTSYSAHRGTYNSNGTSVSAPADTSTSSTREVSTYCPPPPSSGPGEAACKALGYNYNSSQYQRVIFRSSVTVRFTCGEGNNLTLQQAQAIGASPVHSAGCAPLNATYPNTWGTWLAPGYGNTGQEPLPPSGWYFICYTIN